MIEKLIICTSDLQLYILLNKILVESTNIECKIFGTKEYIRNKDFNIINLATSMMEVFNSKPMEFDCQIIETKNKYGLPDYVVTSPNFKVVSKLTKMEMGFKQLEIPLKKVKEFFKDKNVIYAIHTEFSFAYFEEINEKLIDDIMNLLNNILNQEMVK